MSFDWIHENPPHWDEAKQKIIGGAPPGVFDLGERRSGELIPGEWWRVEDQGTVVGYGWMDTTWGDAEILLAVDASRRKQGVGTFILDRLEQEAVQRGLNYMLNFVRPTHPEQAAITTWLEARRFERAHDDRLLRRRTRAKTPNKET